MFAGNHSQTQTDPVINPQINSTHCCFTIQGNIGCGKSTFLEILRSHIPEAKWIQEPVEDWQNLGGKNINMLEKYYKEPKRWGFTFQIYAIFTRIKKLQEAMQRYPDKLKISQRSILADKYVFSELMKDNGYMSESQHEVFKCLYTSFESMNSEENTKIIYLRCSPEKCFERTKARKRPEENEIPLEYLQKIHQKHQNWFKMYNPKRVLILDTSEDFKNNPVKINEMIKELKGFISN